MAESDPLWGSVTDALTPLAQQASATELRRTEKQIRNYFKKAAKSIDFSEGSWWELINEYADGVFGSLFQGLGDKSWLMQADFLLVLDAGIRENFPAKTIAQVPPEDFERSVLAAHDRAFEEQRYLPMLWNAVQELVLLSAGPKAKKKVYEAALQGRRKAMPCCGSTGDANQVKAFVSQWVDATIRLLSRAMHGDPSSAMTEATAVQLFTSLLDAGALPIPLVVEHGPPPRAWPFVDYAVHMAYTAHDEAAALAAKRRLKMREAGKGKSPYSRLIGKGAAPDGLEEEAGGESLGGGVPALMMAKQEPEDSEMLDATVPALTLPGIDGGGVAAAAAPGAPVVKAKPKPKPKLVPPRLVPPRLGTPMGEPQAPKAMPVEPARPPLFKMVPSQLHAAKVEPASLPEVSAEGEAASVSMETDGEAWLFGDTDPSLGLLDVAPLQS